MNISWQFWAGMVVGLFMYPWLFSILQYLIWNYEIRVERQRRKYGDREQDRAEVAGHKQ
jgi:hypothetical protein